MAMPVARPQLTCFYSCALCGAKDRPVQVDARESEQNVVDWVERVVMEAVGRDHYSRDCASPTCDLKIPAPEDADWIGQATKQ